MTHYPKLTARVGSWDQGGLAPPACCPLLVLQCSIPQTLIEKIRSLRPERVAEVEDLVHLLHRRDEDRRLVESAAKFSENIFQKMWDDTDRMVEAGSYPSANAVRLYKLSYHNFRATLCMEFLHCRSLGWRNLTEFHAHSKAKVGRKTWSRENIHER